jgi:hypothetical protein
MRTAASHRERHHPEGSHPAHSVKISADVTSQSHFRAHPPAQHRSNVRKISQEAELPTVAVGGEFQVWHEEDDNRPTIKC